MTQGKYGTMSVIEVRDAERIWGRIHTVFSAFGPTHYIWFKSGKRVNLVKGWYEEKPEEDTTPWEDS